MLVVFFRYTDNRFQSRLLEYEPTETMRNAGNVLTEKDLSKLPTFIVNPSETESLPDLDLLKEKSAKLKPSKYNSSFINVDGSQYILEAKHNPNIETRSLNEYNLCTLPPINTSPSEKYKAPSYVEINERIKNMQNSNFLQVTMHPYNREPTKLSSVSLPERGLEAREGKGSSIEKMCAICLEEYCVGEKIRSLPCGHRYHVDCIDDWLLKKSALCPYCKFNLKNMDENVILGEVNETSRAEYPEIVVIDATSLREPNQEETRVEGQHNNVGPMHQYFLGFKRVFDGLKLSMVH
ncbi:Receptor-like protein [Zancudomyces culisetae]|uniref:Receptor-like protein n=1 Tax=Zancudomyces culisetae TaxID=1213189 RepID=A0A1R1PZC4_ZANCU|nr:Receptor-like protein [Zancudomyces culisetae]|eukprot:OMH86289.1 Receptor-like protein [Zancudomyces culisetae]